MSTSNAVNESAPAKLELHYTVGEIAEKWNVGDNTVRRIFADEPGVLTIGKGSRLIGGRKKKLLRRYLTLRIPESVLLRVQNRLMHKRPSESVSPRVAGTSGIERGGDLHAS